MNGCAFYYDGFCEFELCLQLINLGIIFSVKK